MAVMAGLPMSARDDLESLRASIVRCGAFLTHRGDDWDLANNTVEWINISAQEYLQQYAKDDLGLDMLGMQHGIIALRCLEYIYEVFAPEPDYEVQYDDAISAVYEDDQKSEHSQTREDINGEAADKDNGNGSRTRSDTASFDADDTNLIDECAQYPVRYWVEHAKLAPRDVLDEFNLDHLFWKKDSDARQKWWNLIPDLHTHKNQREVSVLHVGVILNFPALVEYLLDHGRADVVNKDDSLGFQPLYYACEGGDKDIVEALLGANADINYTSNGDQPAALYAAANSGRSEILEMLLERNADLNATSPEHGTALYSAISNSDNEIARLLLDKGAKVNVIGGSALRAINIGAFVGNLEGVKLLIENKAEIDPDEDYWCGSAVGGASRNGHVEVVEYLLSQGWSPNRSIKTYGSFLTAATMYNHVGVVEVLLQKEERVPVLEMALQAASQRGFTSSVKAILARHPNLRLRKAFAQAAYHGRSEVLKLLFTQDKNGEIRDDRSIMDDALYQATDNEQAETVILLLDHGANPNAEGPIYGCALTASAYDGTTKILKALLGKNADVNKRGGEPQHIVLLLKNVKLLLDHGALLNTAPIGYYGNELQAAVYTGDEDTIRMLIKHGADVNAFGGHYSYPIIAAVSQGFSDATRILLEHGAHVNVRGGEDNWPVISLAASTLRKEDLALVLKNVADINATCDKGTTALVNCAAAGDEEGLEFLLDNGTDIHIVSSSLGSALHAAAEIGNEACCEVLLKAGADINAIGGEYGTALQAACNADDIETVSVLLEAGAEVTSQAEIAGHYGTALQAAAAVESLDIVQELINWGAAINVEEAHGTFGCALSAAATADEPDIAKLLIDHGADVNFAGGLNHLPIMAAARSGKLANLQLLLDHGADAQGQGGMWGSTLTAAAYGNDMQCFELLIEHGADIHATGGYYGSALQAAAIKADIAIIDILLDRAFELVNYRGGKYYTPLIAAAYYDRLEVVEKLLNKGADIRHQGGQFRSAIHAAAIKGNKEVLERLLELRPDEILVDEALVEACAHRQAISVSLLLQSRANVFARHPTLGSANDALEAPEMVEENSDDEEDDPEDNDDEDSEDEGVQWVADDGAAVSNEAEDDSVTDLNLEEVVTEKAKIQKLLEEAVARRKRNPTIERFKSVRQQRPLASLSGYPAPASAPPVPQLPPMSTYQAYNSSAGHPSMGTPYGQHARETSSLPYRPGSGPVTPAAISPPAGSPNPYATKLPYGQSSYVGNSAYPHPLFARKPVPSASPERVSSPQIMDQGQQVQPSPQPQRQILDSSVANMPGTRYKPPERKGSDEKSINRPSKVVNRRSFVNLGSTATYQQLQGQAAPRGSMETLTEHQNFAAPSQYAQATVSPPSDPYSSHPPQQYRPLAPPLPYLQTVAAILATTSLTI
ncbi:hypothetical protein ACEQ8H_005121 [Pleosporales sp. CAS-2024a]